jgi:hypothetical protein
MYSGVDESRVRPSQQAGLDMFLDAHGRHWHLIGPCPNGSWHAMPRPHLGEPWIHGATLAELSRNLETHENASLDTG